jgi:hypothetical protein
MEMDSEVKDGCIGKQNEIINMVVIFLSHLRNIIEGLEQVVNVWLHTPLILNHMTNLITLIEKVES